MSKESVTPVSDSPALVLQFGTGRFIRAFADAFIDEANQRGDFSGRVVMIASTSSGRAEQFNKQNGRFTLWARGLVDDKPVDRIETIEAIKRVLSAESQWSDVLELACRPELVALCSNTTEIGLSLVQNDRLDAPISYPARLTALLYCRAQHYEYADDSGIVILPCELVQDNGSLLKSLVMEQSDLWSLSEKFNAWLDHNVTFCNTLVDRIVPGLPDQAELETAYHRIGWRDDLLTVAEPYRLWAIQGDAALAARLGFAKGGGIVVAPDISPYRLRKIRLLNGGHTLSVPIGLLAGCHTVLDNMQHPLVRAFIENILRKEIGPVLDVDPETVPPYISEVLSRWSNPYMHHRLLDITLQSTTKMRHRVVPTLRDYYRLHGSQRVPHRIALGFAAWLRFMRATRFESGTYYGQMHGEDYAINDSQAERLMQWWPNKDGKYHAFVHDVLACEDLWGCDLTQFSGFSEAVENALNVLLRDGPLVAIAGT